MSKKVVHAIYNDDDVLMDAVKKVRGQAVAQVPGVVGASWTSLVLDAPGRGHLLRLALPDDVSCDEARARDLLEAVRTAAGSVPTV